ncbi:hypothetical protein ASD64_06755 [Mesorhizobium sp. Root157]|uniref:glycosyltransferase family 2 protein n=1 Tax=Mesorhizobium sp. Root157 TaxID=1736477 RepID=UPI0006F4E692|nr:glycosyltransferase family 2 protein [Mesorhizobium sp. Root157]KQZ87139.1 hypothetical protein ASD64_06755 [Mesorhizobium sp. Root157]
MFSIVFVTYNSAEVIGDAIRSIPPGNEVIVADNASVDNSVEVCRALGATVLEMPRNLGFGTACNRGAAVATAENILFLNPDAKLESGALEAMTEALARHPRSVAFNPRILNEDGSQFLRRRTILLPRPYLIRPQLPTGDEKIITASGSALLVRKHIFFELGGFDENIFLYYEDDDLCARIIKSGHEMHYIHNAVVYHKGRGSSGNSDDMNAFREYETMKSRIYVSRKHSVTFIRSWHIIRNMFKKAIARQQGLDSKAKALNGRLMALRNNEFQDF